MPTSTRAGHVRFYDTLRQICHCPTGGQRRPPLQNIVRFRRWHVRFCGRVLPGGVEPLPYANLVVFANHQNRAILRVRRARVDVGIDPYERITLSPHIRRFCGCVLPGGAEPRPYGTTKRAAAQKQERFPSSAGFADSFPPSNRGEAFYFASLILIMYHLQIHHFYDKIFSHNFGFFQGVSCCILGEKGALRCTLRRMSGRVS